MIVFGQLKVGDKFKYQQGIYERIKDVYSNCCTKSHNSQKVEGEGPDTLLIPDHIDVEKI